MKNELSSVSRIITGICAVALLFVIFVPLWRIDLVAPQYPEGLVLKIHTNGLAGDVDVINGLNHYIGMQKLRNSDFIEFTLLPYIVGFFALMGVVVFVWKKKWIFHLWSGLFIVFGILAMYDFYRWEYEYGHNLDPTAAIIVPGMSYQPPLIGYKQLLNFGAYSFPDVGGYIFIIVGLLFLFIYFLEWKKVKKAGSVLMWVTCLFIVFITQSCSGKPEPIAYGKDNCTFCKMVISDAKFGAELVTVKGRVFNFDDVHCIVSYLNSGNLEQKEIAAVYLVDFTIKNKFISAGQALLFQSDQLRSPMSGNMAAFSNRDSMNKYLNLYQGTTVQWNSMVKK